MKSLVILAGLFSLALFAGTTSARKHPGEYWQGDLKEQPQLEFNTKNDEPKSEEKSFRKEFARKSSFWVYKDEDAKQIEEKPLRNEFETKPNRRVYSDDVKPRDENLFAKKFERKSSFWVNNDEDAKQREEKPLRKEFETRPNFWVYNDDGKLKEESFFHKLKEFEAMQ